MKIACFKEDEESSPMMNVEDWRALYKAGWIVDWAIRTTPEERLWILRGEVASAQAAYFPVTSIELGAESWRRTLPHRDVPSLSLAALPLHLAAECPDVVPFHCVVDVPALAELREMPDGEIASLAARIAVGAFGWVAGALHERGCGKWNLVKGNIARAVRKTVWEHMQGSAGAQCLSGGEGGNG